VRWHNGCHLGGGLEGSSLPFGTIAVFKRDLAPQPLKENPDLLFGGVLPAGGLADLRDNVLVHRKFLSGCPIGNPPGAGKFCQAPGDPFPGRPDPSLNVLSTRYPLLMTADNPS